MRLKERGKSTSASEAASEVTGIGRSGFWLLHEGGEYFVPFDDYPVFRNASVKNIYAMRSLGGGQLRWDALDCDIEVAALGRPESYPLAFKS